MRRRLSSKRTRELMALAGDEGQVGNVMAALQSERSLQESVRQLAKLTGWLYFHGWTMLHSQPGFPDTVLINPPRLIVAELKVEGEDPTDEQEVWLANFRACGVEAYVWRPSDWPTIEAILKGER